MPSIDGCRFCADNGKLNIIRSSPSGNTHFVQVVQSINEQPVLAAGAYFVIPHDHFLPGEDMPFDFMREVNWHVRESGLVFDNDGINRTPKGGGLVRHLHYWLMQVQPGDEPLGLYSLRASHRQLVLARSYDLSTSGLPH